MMTNHSLVRATIDLASTRGPYRCPSVYALAVPILGRWTRIVAPMACLFFEFSDGLQLRLQFNSPSVPNQLLSMVPFVASFLALVFFVGKVRPPVFTGIRFERGGK